MDAREVMKVTIAEAVDQYIEERQYALDAVWREHEDAIQLLIDITKHKKYNAGDIMGVLGTARENARLKAKNERLQVSRDTLIKEADYLRNQLRLDDKDFYDHLSYDNDEVTP